MRLSQKESYRSLELLCRQQAALSSTPATRNELERMATEYKRLADWLENQWPNGAEDESKGGSAPRIQHPVITRNQSRPMPISARGRGSEMCDKCEELDAKIEHLQNVIRWFDDEAVISGINSLIAQYQAEKRALHPEQE